MLEVLKWVLQHLGVDLLGDDLSTNVVLLQKANAHLLQDVLRLLLLLHGTKGLHLNLLQDLGSLRDLTLALADVGELEDEAGTLLLNEDLPRL